MVKSLLGRKFSDSAAKISNLAFYIGQNWWPEINGSWQYTFFAIL